MARAKRHYLPGHIWHITHRCHKKEFLLKFSRDRQRWCQWLYQAKKRYGLTILNYVVTSNHIHLLVMDDGARETIPRSMQLVAGRTGQEYNQRKNRRGSFWEDRYHATAIEDGDHFRRCLVYIDLNMVRAGVVKQPSQWLFGGYNEIQSPKRKNVLINYDRLVDILGMQSYDAVKQNHKMWVNEELAVDRNQREEKWTKSVAVGSKEFVESVQMNLGSRANGRNVQGGEAAYQLREPTGTYNPILGAEKGNIGDNNGYIWSNNII